MNRLIIFARCTNREKRVFLLAVALLVYYRLAIKFLPLQKLLMHAGAKSTGPAPAASESLAPTRIMSLFKAADRIVPCSTCLSRAFAGHRLYAGNGYRCTIHIGVAIDNQAGFEAHAWLKLNDSIILGNLPDLEKYQELPLCRRP